MNIRDFCVLLGLAVSIFEGLPVAAQSPNLLLELGPVANAYRGDLSSGFNKWNGAIQTGLQFYRDKRVNLKVGLMVGQVTGQDRGFESSIPGIETPRFVRTRMVAVHGEAQFNFIKKENLHVYLSQGLGLLRFSPQDEAGGQLADRLDTRLPGEDYANATLMLPTGIGAIYLLKTGFGGGVSVGLLNPLTQYLDNIGQAGPHGKNDQVWAWKFSFFVPLSFDKFGNARR